MYCENCGRWLEEGQKCDCRKQGRRSTQILKSKRKKKSGIGFNGKTIFSFIFLTIGIISYWYFNFNEITILEMIPFKVIHDIQKYLCYGIPAFVFLLGLIAGIWAIRKKKWKILSWIGMLFNLIAVLGMCVLIGLEVYQNYKIMQMISGEITEENRDEIENVYAEAPEGSRIRSKVEDNLSKVIENLKESFNAGDITYDEADSQLNAIDSMDILTDEVYDAAQYMESLNQSKEAFENADALAENESTMLQAVNLYKEVSEEDDRYQEAQNKIEEIQKRVSDLVDKGITDDNIDTMKALYKDADEELKVKIEEAAVKQVDSLKDLFTDDNISYEDMISELAEFEGFTSISDEINIVKGYAESLNNSKIAYQNATELEKNPDTILDAVIAYREVLEEDKNYEKAQQKAAELLNSMAESSKNEVKKLAEERNYQDALSLIDGYVEIFPDDTEFPAMREKYAEEYADYALQTADQLIQEQKYDEAKSTLNTAYMATKQQELLEKANLVDEYRPVNLIDMHVLAGNNYEIKDEIADSYGNIHTNVMQLDTYNNGRILYQLDGQYSSFDGYVVSPDNTTSRASMNFVVFADDELVYAAAEITRQQGMKEIHIDLTDVQQLMIQTTGTGVGYESSDLCITEGCFTRSNDVSEPQKRYERLKDNVIVDSGSIETSDTLMLDSFGNFHNGFIKMNAYRSGYVLFNLNQKYVDFSGKVVTSGDTDVNESIIIRIFVDDQLVFEKTGISKTTEFVSFSLDVTNGKVLKIVATGDEVDRYNPNCYIADDKLYFEKTDEIIEAELETLNGRTTPETNVIPESESNTEITPAPISASEPSNHRYEVFLQNGTWEDAFNACKEKGGYLVRIDSADEYSLILNQLESLGCREYRLYIGGRRDLSGQQYYWVDNANAFIGDALNGSNAWCAGNWMIGEPSFRDDVVNADEHVMELFYYESENRWVWNDVPNNLPDYIGDAAEKVGYICEYDS